jgi:hypothetical protein
MNIPACMRFDVLTVVTVKILSLGSDIYIGRWLSTLEEPASSTVLFIITIII